MSNFKHKYTSGENKQKDKQAILDIFNRMTVEDAFKMIDVEEEEASYIVWTLRKLICNNKGVNPYMQLQTFRKFVPKLINKCFFYEAVADYSFEQIDRLLNGIDVNKNKRWEPEDEEALIEMVCADVNDVEIAVRFGRSIPAIKTKVSQLVGIGRLDKKVAGRFIGNIDGEYKECMIDGTVTRSAV